MSSIISGKTCDQSGRPVIMNWTVQTLVTTPWWLYSHSYQTSDINCMISFPINNLLFCYKSQSVSWNTLMCIYALPCNIGIMWNSKYLCQGIGKYKISITLQFPLNFLPFAFSSPDTQFLQLRFYLPSGKQNFWSCPIIHKTVLRTKTLTF